MKRIEELFINFALNKFGITWCVICGMLGNHNVVSQPLKEEDKIEIIRK